MFEKEKYAKYAEKVYEISPLFSRWERGWKGENCALCYKKLSSFLQG